MSSEGERRGNGFQGNQVDYQMIGLPTLLFRNKKQYSTSFSKIQFQKSLDKTKIEREARRWKRKFSKMHQLKARFYDTLGRLSMENKVKGFSRDQLFLPTSYSSWNKIDTSQLGLLRKRLFPQKHVLAKTSQSLDQAIYLDESELITAKDTKALLKISKIYSAERTKASYEYLAPFHSSSLMWGLTDDCVITKNSTKTYIPEIPKAGPHEAKDVGNCLFSFKCHCCHFTNYILHPTGTFMSTICISAVTFSTVDSITKLESTSTDELEIGEKIFQIEQCTPWDAHGKISFAIRSQNFTTLISIETHGEKKENRCVYNIQFEGRIDLRSTLYDLLKAKPSDLAVHSNYGIVNTEPLVAISSDSKQYGKTTIHIGVNNSYCHRISNLQNIEQIEFCVHHPMLLHAAATSYVRPNLVPNFSSHMSSLGNGSALYTIDLRSNQACFQWSPSAEEFRVEGLYSVSGILPDWKSEYRLFVASTAASKLWEIDSRMPYKSVLCWSLPGLYHSVGQNTFIKNPHGNGTLLYRPPWEYKNEVLRPILSVEKEPSTPNFSIYQEPVITPRFGTNCFEVSRGPALAETSVKRGSIVPLYDVSKKVFVCGISSFRLEGSELLTQGICQNLETSEESPKVLCVITLTNKGDLYSNLLWEKNIPNSIPRRGKNIGIEIASNSQKVPCEVLNAKENAIRTKFSESSVRSQLTNSSPIRSSQLLSTIVEKRVDCAPFFSFNFNNIQNNLLKSNCKERRNITKKLKNIIISSKRPTLPIPESQHNFEIGELFKDNFACDHNRNAIEGDAGEIAKQIWASTYGEDN